jgi:hypothetical protein
VVRARPSICTVYGAAPPADISLCGRLPKGAHGSASTSLSPVYRIGATRLVPLLDTPLMNKRKPTHRRNRRNRGHPQLRRHIHDRRQPPRRPSALNQGGTPAGSLALWLMKAFGLYSNRPFAIGVALLGAIPASSDASRGLIQQVNLSPFAHTRSATV